MVMQYGENKDPRQERDDSEYDPGVDRSLEMLGGLLIAVIVIALSVGLYFIFTRLL